MDGDGKVISTYPSDIFERLDMEALKSLIRSSIKIKDKVIERYLFNKGKHILEEYIQCLSTATFKEVFFKESYLKDAGVKKYISIIPSFHITYKLHDNNTVYLTPNATVCDDILGNGTRFCKFGPPSDLDGGLSKDFAERFSQKITIPDRTVKDVYFWAKRLFEYNQVFEAVKYGLIQKINNSMKTESFKKDLDKARRRAFEERMFRLLDEFPECSSEEYVIDIWNKHNIDLIMS